MAQIIRWIGILAVIWTVGCGKKGTQVVVPQAEMDSDVAVWVDDASITAVEIQAEVQRLFEKTPKGFSEEQLPLIRMQLLQKAVDNLVVRQLVRAEMQQSGILISQEEIDKGKADLEAGLGEGQSLAMMLAMANLPMEELEMNLRLDLFKNKVLKEKQTAAVDAVTDEVVETFYNDNPDEFTKKEGRLVSHIFLKTPSDADEATLMDLRAKAEGLRSELIEGADFEKLASEKSECASRAKGGQLGVIPRGREPKAFEDAVYGQEIGVIGEVVQSPQGFHIIKVTGAQKQELVPFNEVSSRLAVVLKTKAREQVSAEYLIELREKATIKLDGPLAQVVEAAKAAQVADAVAENESLFSIDSPATPPPAAPAIP